MKLRNWVSTILCTGLLIFSVSTAGAASTTTTYFFDDTVAINCETIIFGTISKSYEFDGYFTANDITGEVLESDSLPFDLTYYDGSQIFKIYYDFDKFATYLGLSYLEKNLLEPFLTFLDTDLAVTVDFLNFKVGTDCCNLSNTLTVNPVPVPAAVWLFGSGLLGLVGFRRRMTK